MLRKKREMVANFTMCFVVIGEKQKYEKLLHGKGTAEASRLE